MLASNIKTAPCRYGEIAYHADDQFIGHSLEKYGEYSELEVALWRKLIPPGATVLDVGANIGALSLALADIVGPTGHVFAFEPQPENFGLLARNIELNKLDAVVSTLDCALGDEHGTVRVPPLAGLGHRNYGAVELGGEFGDRVSTKPLDSFGLESVHFIKIDVEGYEAQVLRGARETIKRCRPLLYVEADRQEKFQALIAFIRKLDYRLFRHSPPLFNPDNRNGEAENDFGNIVSFNLLCVPKEVDGWRAVTDTLVQIHPATPNGNRSGWAGIARLGGVGDNLIAASVLRPLKALGYKIDVISQSPQSAVFENNPFIDKLSVKDGTRDLPVNDQQGWQNWFKSRSYEYDLFVNLSHTCEYLMADFPASTSYYWPTEFRRKLHGGNYLEVVHDIVGVPYDFGPLFFPTDDEKDFALETRRKLGGDQGPVIGWTICGTRPDKVYRATALVISRLIRELGAHVVLLGAPPPAPDAGFAKLVEDHVGEQNGSLAGLHHAISTDTANPNWPIRRILTFAAACDLIIGPDTGPSWGVAFEPVPKMILLSHASATNITKHWINTVSLHADPRRVPCWPCHKLHDGVETCVEEQRRHGMKPQPNQDGSWNGIGAACITSISVETIVAKARELLTKER